MIYIVSILFFLAFGVLVVLFFVFVLDSLWGGHDLPSSRRVIKHLIEAISQYNPKAAILYDLGCGRGTVALAINKKWPRLETRGLDNSAIRIFFARLKARWLGRKVNFKKQDFFQIDLRDADVVYAYLWHDLMPLLEKKLRNELKRGAMVITNTTKFPNWQPVQKVITYPRTPKTPDFETLFVYVKS